MDKKYIDLQQPVFTKTRPLVIRAVVEGKITLTEMGPMQADQKIENYILLSALPNELQEKVKQAIQFLISGV